MSQELQNTLDKLNDCIEEYGIIQVLAFVRQLCIEHADKSSIGDHWHFVANDLEYLMNRANPLFSDNQE